MKHLSRFYRFLTQQAIYEEKKGLDNRLALDTLLLFEVAAHVYEQAELFEDRLCRKEEVSYDDVEAFLVEEGGNLLEAVSKMLGLDTVIESLAQSYGHEPISRKLLALAEDE